MRVNIDTNLLKMIRDKYEKEDSYFSIEGFYYLSFEFLSSPQRLKNGFFGYQVNINGNPFYITDAGVFTLADEDFFTVTSISFPYEADVNVYYEVKGTLYSQQSYPEELLDRRYSQEKVSEKCKEIYIENRAELINTNLFSEIEDKITGVIIEAQEGSIFNINNAENHLMIGASDFLYYYNEVTSLKYLGYKEHLEDEEYLPLPREIKIKYFYEEG